MCKISNSKLILWDVQPPALSLKMKMVVSGILRGSTSMSVVGGMFFKAQILQQLIWYDMVNLKHSNYMGLTSLQNL